MTFPSIVDQVRQSNQSSVRPDGKVRRFVWHHQAGTNDDATIRMMVEATRQVSSTFTVDNKPPKDQPTRKWARITGVVPIERRPWTSSSAAADGLAFTAEVCNSSGSPSWGISESTVQACALIAAWAYLEHGVPLRRATKADTSGHLGHSEVIGMFGQGYSTACPLNLPIDRILSIARELVEGKNERSMVAALNRTPIEEGDPVKVFPHRSDSRSEIVLSPQQGTFLRAPVNGKQVDIDMLEVSAAGVGEVLAHVYAKAAPGEAVDVKILRYNPNTKSSSDDFTTRLVADKDGNVLGSVAFLNRKEPDWRWLLHVYAPSSNKNPVTITRLAADAILFEPK